MPARLERRSAGSAPIAAFTSAESSAPAAAVTSAAGLTPAAGFTLVELMVVMLIIAVLSAIAIPSYITTLKTGREATLREDLRVMRAAIISYTRDKGKAPHGLDDLVQAGYLTDIPTDPFTHSRDTWTPENDTAYYDIDESEPGMVDVHSGATGTGSDDQPYANW